MENVILNLEELAEKSGSPAAEILGWINEGIFFPEGHASDSTPIFSNGSLKSIEKIRSLLELGYDPPEIKKIIKKVGLPDQDKDSRRNGAEKNQFLTVGSLAEQIEVSPRTIKHWEEKGIIEPDLRSSGGYRLYRDYYVLLCNLIKDLQLFGYSLDEIKKISDFFREFISIRDNIETHTTEEVSSKLEQMENEISVLFNKTAKLKDGIKRWEDLLKKQKKQISVIKEKNKKRNPDKNDEK